MQEWAKAYDIKSVHHAFASCVGCLNHQSEFRVAEMLRMDNHTSLSHMSIMFYFPGTSCCEMFI